MLKTASNSPDELNVVLGCWRDPCTGDEHSAGPHLLVHGDEDEEQGLGRDKAEYKDKS